MEPQTRLTLQVAELMHYCTDVDTSLAFYKDKLGWGLVWQEPGSIAVLDAGGAYQLVLVSTRWARGWREGRPIPAPQLSLESQDLATDLDLLQQRGLPELAIQGDPEDMLFASVPFVEGFSMLAWQDNESGGATKVVQEYFARGGHEKRYSLGEAIYFVEDKPQALGFLTHKLGFEVKFSHGDVYTALAIGDGPLVGVFDLPKLQSSSVFSPGGARIRLFLECPDIEGEHRRQAADGTEPGQMHPQSDGLNWFSTADPDGTMITFWQYSAPAGDSTGSM